MEKLVKITIAFYFENSLQCYCFDNQISNKTKLWKTINFSAQIISQTVCHHNSSEIFYLPDIIDNNTYSFFSDELELLFIKSPIVCSIVAHKLLEKPNTPFPSGEKAIVKRLLWSAISNARIIPFF